MYPLDVDEYQSKKRIGISCTGAFMFPEWLERQNCPTILIDRDVCDINDSLHAIGMGGISGEMLDKFRAARGRRYRYKDLWDQKKATEMWSFLLPDIPFDPERYRYLCEMQVQPDLRKWKPNVNIMFDLIRKGALCRGQQQ
jgi:hypothetical protein